MRYCWSNSFGPEPAQYNLGVEFHDTRKWDQAVRAMTPYFQRIAEEHEAGDPVPEESGGDRPGPTAESGHGSV